MRIAGQAIETADDVQRICGERWQEGQQLEFKREGSRHGKGIAKEVVAVANHLGGHVIIGIDEDKQMPGSAARIVPVAHCSEEASGLERQLRDKIDPPIRGLTVTSIVTEQDGGGVIIIEVPQSLFGPHRSGFDSEVYQRSGTESRPLKMNEIHRLVFAFEKREDRVEERFTKLRAPHGHQFNAKLGELHFRVAAVPTGDILVILAKVPPPWFVPIKIATRSGVIEQTEAMKTPVTQCPMLRGMWREMASDFRNLRSHWSENGSLQLTRLVRGERGAVAYASEVIETFFSLLLSIDAAAAAADFPGGEYGIECEIGSYGGIRLMRFGAPKNIPISRASDFAYPNGGSVSGRTLPRYVYSPSSDGAAKLALVNLFWLDFWNSLGADPPDTIDSIEILADPR